MHVLVFYPLMSKEHLAKKNDIVNVSRCHSVNQKSHMDDHGNEPLLPRRGGEDKRL